MLTRFKACLMPRMSAFYQWTRQKLKTYGPIHRVIVVAAWFFYLALLIAPSDRITIFLFGGMLLFFIVKFDPSEKSKSDSTSIEGPLNTSDSMSGSSWGITDPTHPSSVTNAINQSSNTYL